MNDPKIKEKKLNTEVILNIQKSASFESIEIQSPQNNDNKEIIVNDKKYIFFGYFNILLLTISLIFDSYKFYHNLKNATFNWLYLPIILFEDIEDDYKYTRMKIFQLVGICSFILLSSYGVNIGIQKLIIK